MKSVKKSAEEEFQEFIRVSYGATGTLSKLHAEAVAEAVNEVVLKENRACQQICYSAYNSGTIHYSIAGDLAKMIARQ